MGELNSSAVMAYQHRTSLPIVWIVHKAESRAAGKGGRKKKRIPQHTFDFSFWSGINYEYEPSAGTEDGAACRASSGITQLKEGEKKREEKEFHLHNMSRWVCYWNKSGKLKIPWKMWPIKEGWGRGRRERLKKRHGIMDHIWKRIIF